MTEKLLISSLQLIFDHFVLLSQNYHTNSMPPKQELRSKKDIFAASILLNFKNLVPVIIISDLLTRY